MGAFEKLNAINVNGHTEKKNGLTYLSWAWAWAEVKKVYPDATYHIFKDEQGRPYIEDPGLGFMVYTSVTIEDQTHEMWLPVMDGANKAMKREPYTVKTKYGKELTVNAATMFDVNTAIMRCLTKNLAMHGLGLYIYAGEDLPEDQRAAGNVVGDIDENIFTTSMSEQAASTGEQEDPLKVARRELRRYCDEHQLDLAAIWDEFSITRDMPADVIRAKLDLVRQTYGN